MATQPDISGLDRKQLASLTEQIAERQTAIEQEFREKAIEAAEKAVEKFGFTTAELFGKARKKASTSKRSPARPKYQNPEDESVTWSGRGKTPRWLTSLEGQGRKREEFLIPEANA